MSDDTLLTLAHQSDSIMQEIVETGEIKPEQEAALAALAKKVDACEAVRMAFAAHVSRFDQHIKLLQEYRDRVRRGQEAFDDYVTHCVREAPGQALEGELLRYALQLNNPSVVVENEELVPKEYMREKVTVSLDKKAVLEDLKSGSPVPGCRMERSQRLVCKPRMSARKAIA